NMAEPWNRLNIPFPSAVSSVRIQYTATTDLHVRSVLVHNEKVLKLIRSEILQTEIRVLYELLYVLNNSCRGHRTFRALKQVEQCINRLKDMKLDVALQDLSDLCPSGIQRSVSLKVCEASVPSQPMLEWVCLRVLGAAQLLNRTMSRCSRAFVLSKHHFKWEEFIVLNMVITSMLSRLWVVFRGVLVSLSTLYLELLHLRGVVAHARPMPFLTSFSLPVDLLDFLGPGGSVLIKRSLQSKKPEEKKRRRQKKEKHQQTRRVPEDLGVSVHRDSISSQLTLEQDLTQKKQTFKEQMRGATSFTDAGIHLEKMIQWCRSQRMEREKRLLTFLRLKCQKMKSLEAAGYR
uniref:Nucleolus and neural progenitor protein-like N-terminal domain-containing protein n=1 Tax=Sphaeramia orbicularis TaxID=375764 RepID=A0A672YZM4_9TELE